MDRDQLVKAARRMLLADTGFAALIGTDVGRDTMFADQYPDQAYVAGWVFRGIDVTSLPYRDPSGTGTSAVTMSYRSDWSVANRHNSARFPQLVFTIRSDLSRVPGESTRILARDAEGRCDRVARAIRNVFHDVGNTRHWWGTQEDFPPDGVYVTSSLEGAALEIQDVQDSDGLVLGIQRFNLVTD